ncbi:MAG: prolyl oligopeptidase family serine peptidase [Gemmatimonadota bacterium]
MSNNPRFPVFLLAAALGSALGLLAAPAAVAQESFTLEQVMSDPFPSGLVAAPAGGALAWVQDAEGVRNLWAAMPPDYQGRAVTPYAEDDGQELADLHFTPDGRHLVYVRGGAPNRQGEIPNPTSSAEGAERAIWWVGLDPEAKPAPVKLAEGASPAVSPRGDGVAFVRRGQVWWVDLPADEASKRATPTEDMAPEPGAGATPAQTDVKPHNVNRNKPKQLFKIRGRASSLRWSPDGRRLAFVSARGDHAFIGVYDVGARRLRYMDPSVDRDGSPVWSPDGARIAFLRIPNEARRLPFAPRRSGLPWSIRVADPATGEGREVWRAEEGPGSVFRNVESRGQLWWAADDRLVFPWERDGWTHLYSVAVAGGAARLLTPGSFEVEHVTLTPDGRDVVYSSNQGDIDRRHIWRVPAGGETPRPVTHGDGIEWAPAVTSNGAAVAVLASDARRPAHAALVTGSGSHPLAPRSLPADFPADRLVVPRQVIFSAADGLRIHGQLFLPPDLRPGDRRPALLFFHGGSRRQMLLGWHYRGYYHNAYAMNQYLASRGYIVLAVNYRSGIGYGLEFREALNYGARGASEFNDVMGAGLYLRSRPDVDPNRIGLWGGSYGGYLTALGLSRASDLFAAGVDLHGVHDWNEVIRNFVPSYDAAKRAEFARLAFESSPMASIEGWRSPVLLIQGDDDRNVPFSETVHLAEALRRRGVEVEQLVFPDEVHGFLLHRSWLAAYHAAADFFDRKLKGARGAAAAAGGAGGGAP